jgi:hypothetical protein
MTDKQFETACVTAIIIAGMFAASWFMVSLIPVSCP